jgi:hypothetical protein
MDFFFLRQNLFGDSTGLEIEGHTETSAQFNWVDGVKFDRPFPRETFLLDDAYGSNYPDFFDTSVPVMSSRLLEQLLGSGVSNLDTYPVVLRNRSDASERDDYRAVNVIGRIDAVDLSASVHEVRRGKPRFTGAIAIDGHLAAGLLAFRLPYSPRFIVVAESVAQRIRQFAFDSVLLQPTRSYQGV